MDTYIEVVGTRVVGWSSGAPATENYFNFDFIPEKPLEAYEYVEVTETITVPDPDDPENSTIEEEAVSGYVVQERADWVEPEIPEEV